MDERDYKAMNEELNQPSCLAAVSGSSIDWNDFAEALKEQFGESLIEEEKGEEDPNNWWLTDVTVEDIVEFVTNYR